MGCAHRRSIAIGMHGQASGDELKDEHASRARVWTHELKQAKQPPLVGFSAAAAAAAAGAGAIRSASTDAPAEAVRR